MKNSLIYRIITKQLVSILIILLPVLSFGQNKDMAKAYYEKAGEAYNQRNYQKAIGYIENAKEQLGTTNPHIMYLEAKSRFALGKLDDKIELLVADFFKKSNTDDPRRTEMSVLLINYREKEADLRKQEEKLKEERRIAEEKRYIEEETQKEYQRLEEEKRKEEQRLKEEKRIEYQRLVQEMQEEFSKQSENAGNKQSQGNKEVQFVLNKYFAATGANKAKSFISMSISSSSAIDGIKQVEQSKTLCTIDGKYKMVYSSSSGEEIARTVVKGKNGYSAAGDKKYPISPELIASYTKPPYLRLFPEFELMNKQGVSMDGIEEFEGRKAYVIKDKNISYYYDVATNFKIGSVSIVKTPKHKLRIVLTYKDYKEYDGIKIPISSILDNGTSVTRIKVIDVKFNDIYMDKDFK